MKTAKKYKNIAFAVKALLTFRMRLGIRNGVFDALARKNDSNTDN